MNKLLMSAVMALVGGCLWAQTQGGELPKATTASWKGTLVDSGCPSQKSEVPKTTGDSNSNSDSNTSYGLITADGECIPFDVGSNAKILGMLKIPTDWSKNTVRFEPRKVKVVGTQLAGTISVYEIELE